MQNHQYGTYQLGRLTYRTAEEARAVADELGLASVHKHDMEGELVWMPGESMDALNAALERRGMQAAAPASARRRSGGDGGLFDLDVGMGTGGDNGGFF